MKKSFFRNVFSILALSTMLAFSSCGNEQPKTPSPAVQTSTCTDSTWAVNGILYERKCFNNGASHIVIKRFDTATVSGNMVIFYQVTVEGASIWSEPQLSKVYSKEARLSLITFWDIIHEGEEVTAYVYEQPNLSNSEEVGREIVAISHKDRIEIPKATRENYPDYSFSELQETNKFLDKNRATLVRMALAPSAKSLQEFGLDNPFLFDEQLLSDSATVAAQ